MRLIDADKLHIDKQINGECLISQEHIINALTVEAIPLSVIEDIKTYVHNYIILSESEEEKLIGFIDQKIKECTHET